MVRRSGRRPAPARRRDAGSRARSPGEDVLAVALEAEMARLDDAGVHRPDRDLVDLLALDPEEVGDAGQDGGSPVRDQTHRQSGIVRVEAHRLEPRVALGHRRPTARRSRARTSGPAGSRASARDSVPLTSVATTAERAVARHGQGPRTAASRLRQLACRTAPQIRPPPCRDASSTASRNSPKGSDGHAFARRGLAVVQRECV